jgi:hypothetical protein
LEAASGGFLLRGAGRLQPVQEIWGALEEAA